MPLTFCVPSTKRAAAPTASSASNRRRSSPPIRRGRFRKRGDCTRLVNRPNLMIKVVATKDGVAAVEALIAEGVNVNITLISRCGIMRPSPPPIFADCSGANRPGKVASVASFFVSRVDTQVDKALDAIGSPEALALRGKIAIANAKAMYQRFQEIFRGDEFAALRRRGARVQRPFGPVQGRKTPLTATSFM